jgi:tetrahydromethanopterin S-methyltransferase subunit G
MARRITIDQLAAMVARDFEDVGRRFEDVGRRFDGVAGEFENVRREMREGFASLRAVQDDHSHRLDRIERKLDSVVDRVDGHDVRLQALEKRRGPRP